MSDEKKSSGTENAAQTQQSPASEAAAAVNADAASGAAGSAAARRPSEAVRDAIRKQSMATGLVYGGPGWYTPRRADAYPMNYASDGKAQDGSAAADKNKTAEKNLYTMMAVYAGPAMMQNEACPYGLLGVPPELGDAMKRTPEREQEHERENEEKARKGLCHMCGTELPKNRDYRFCPECGTPVIRFCPDCGGRMERGNRVCARCDRKQDAVCPACGDPLRSTGKFCENCGSLLTVPCGSCGHSIHRIWKRCPECGAEQ